MRFFGLGWTVYLIFMAVGWVLNIVTIVSHINDPITTMTVLRVVGIVAAPLGGVMGYI